MKSITLTSLVNGNERNDNTVWQIYAVLSLWAVKRKLNFNIKVFFQIYYYERKTNMANACWEIDLCQVVYFLLLMVMHQSIGLLRSTHDYARYSDKGLTTHPRDLDMMVFIDIFWWNCDINSINILLKVGIMRNSDNEMGQEFGDYYSQYYSMSECPGSALGVHWAFIVHYMPEVGELSGQVLIVYQPGSRLPG